MQHNDTIAALIATAFGTTIDHATHLAEHFWPYLQIGDLPTLRRITGLADDHLAPFVASRTLLGHTSDTSLIMNSPHIIGTHAMQHYGGKDQEHVVIYALNSKNILIQEFVVYIGTVNAANIRPAECFKDAIRINAPNIVMVHNHPSGVPQPSRDDITITTTMIKAGALLDITLVDHIIVGPTSYVSLRELFPDLWDKKGVQS